MPVQFKRINVLGLGMALSFSTSFHNHIWSLSVISIIIINIYYNCRTQGTYIF